MKLLNFLVATRIAWLTVFSVLKSAENAALINRQQHAKASMKECAGQRDTTDSEPRNSMLPQPHSYIVIQFKSFDTQKATGTWEDAVQLCKDAYGGELMLTSSLNFNHFLLRDLNETTACWVQKTKPKEGLGLSLYDNMTSVSYLRTELISQYAFKPGIIAESDKDHVIDNDEDVKSGVVAARWGGCGAIMRNGWATGVCETSVSRLPCFICSTSMSLTFRADNREGRLIEPFALRRRLATDPQQNYGTPPSGSIFDWFLALKESPSDSVQERAALENAAMPERLDPLESLARFFASSEDQSPHESQSGYSASIVDEPSENADDVKSATSSILTSVSALLSQRSGPVSIPGSLATLDGVFERDTFVPPPLTEEELYQIIPADPPGLAFSVNGEEVDNVPLVATNRYVAAERNVDDTKVTDTSTNNSDAISALAKSGFDTEGIAIGVDHSALMTDNDIEEAYGSAFNNKNTANNGGASSVMFTLPEAARRDQGIKHDIKNAGQHGPTSEASIPSTEHVNSSGDYNNNSGEVSTTFEFDSMPSPGPTEIPFTQATTEAQMLAAIPHSPASTTLNSTVFLPTADSAAFISSAEMSPVKPQPQIPITATNLKFLSHSSRSPSLLSLNRSSEISAVDQRTQENGVPQTPSDIITPETTTAPAAADVSPSQLHQQNSETDSSVDLENFVPAEILSDIHRSGTLNQGSTSSENKNQGFQAIRESTTILIILVMLVLSLLLALVTSLIPLWKLYRQRTLPPASHAKTPPPIFKPQVPAEHNLSQTTIESLTQRTSPVVDMSPHDAASFMGNQHHLHAFLMSESSLSIPGSPVDTTTLTKNKSFSYYGKSAKAAEISKWQQGASPVGETALLQSTAVPRKYKRAATKHQLDSVKTLELSIVTCSKSPRIEGLPLLPAYAVVPKVRHERSPELRSPAVSLTRSRRLGPDTRTSLALEPRAVSARRSPTKEAPPLSNAEPRPDRGNLSPSSSMGRTPFQRAVDLTDAGRAVPNSTSEAFSSRASWEPCWSGTPLPRPVIRLMESSTITGQSKLPSLSIPERVTTTVAARTWSQS